MNIFIELHIFFQHHFRRICRFRYGSTSAGAPLAQRWGLRYSELDREREIEY